MSEDRQPIRSALLPYHQGPGGNPRAVQQQEDFAAESGDLTFLEGDELAKARFFDRKHREAEKARSLAHAVFDG